MKSDAETSRVLNLIGKWSDDSAWRVAAELRDDLKRTRELASSLHADARDARFADHKRYAKQEQENAETYCPGSAGSGILTGWL